jgi:uncharacterized delta-60 repeat protein
MPVPSPAALAVVLLLAATLPGAAGAAPGDLDQSFGGDGIVTTDFGVGGESASALGILPNGKVVAAGEWGDGFALARYLPDGVLDPVFDGDGMVTTDFGSAAHGGVNGLAIQANGRILAAGGSGDFALARYRRDGSLDQSLDADGRVTTDFGRDEVGQDVVVQPDGKIVLIGTSVEDGPGGDWALARYNSDGSLDESFGSGGKVLTDLGVASNAYAVALQEDGRIVVAGNSGAPAIFVGDVALARYEVDGSLDPSFGDGGIVILDLGDPASGGAVDLVVQADGAIVVAGVVRPQGAHLDDADFLLARFNPDGSLATQVRDPYLDAPFGTDGIVTTDLGADDFALAIAIESGGKLVVTGVTGPNNPGPAVALDLDSLVVARYGVDGSLDPAFGSGGTVTTDFGGTSSGWDVAVQADGGIVVAGRAEIGGSSQFAVARYLAQPCCVVGAGSAGVP